MMKIARYVPCLLFVVLCTAARHVIVVGSGLAGLSAAIEAARAGAQVTIFEKEDRVGGNSVRASSGMNAVDTPAQISTKVQDAVGYFVDDTIKSGLGYSNKNLVALLAQNSSSAWNFLHNIGVDLSVVTKTGGHSRARTHRAQERDVPVSIGTHIIRTLRAYVEHMPEVKIITKARVMSLMSTSLDTILLGSKITRDERDGVADFRCDARKVTGVCVLVDGKEQAVLADAVILATGGFCGVVTSESLLAKYRPDLLTLSTTNGSCASGDGIILAHAVGATLIDMEKVQVHPTGFVDPKDPLKKQKILAPENLRAVGGILLDQHGKRFVDELSTRDGVTNAIMKNCAPYKETGPRTAYVLLNETGAKLFQKSMLGFYTKMGLVQRFETLAVCAEFMGVPESVLKKTLDQYAHAAVYGKDEFGKTTFPTIFSCDEPLYCMLVTPCLHYCMGGVQFDEQARVIGEQGPISGLYAAGEVTGGLHGANRLCGNSLLECVVFGRLAGNFAASGT